ncbi:enoyl-CoA hydratase-related protein [Henriciella mobilis]|uniref:Enoyl-CoA hydratase n=1 Tax=Henriciella mobilis TaxID=2305467 RepID=A0A399RJF2_9PROT|nr:enoyl-CoA hydratase-related protein [Henriciella mobilis]RIJ29865.1 enoyl-CoA hydratase [Henriciella mobilis]
MPATNKRLSTRTPVIAAIGEVTDRPDRIEEAREPVELMAAALRAAEADGGRSLLAALTSVYLVGQMSWPYRNPVRELCDRLEINPACAVNESFGGDTPVRLIHAAARRIASGEAETAAIVGGEALNSLRKARQAGIRLDWTERAPAGERLRSDFEVLKVHEAARKAGVSDPADLYPLFENALTHASGISPTEAQEQASQIWAGMARSAAKNEFAWSRSAPSAQEIAVASPANRMIAFPYTKFMVANPMVNQAAAIIVTSLEHALALGIERSNLIFIRGGAFAAEPEDALMRDRFDGCAALDTVMGAVVDSVGGSAGTFDCLELYSCFPVVPKLALSALSQKGLPENVPASVTGGLTFFGGPLNNYMSHATAAMVRKMRSGAARTGLLYAQGGVLTKHHALVLSAEEGGYEDCGGDPSWQEAADHARGPVPAILDGYEGPAELETFTVKYGRLARAQFGVAILRAPDGSRVIARVRPDDKQTMELLLSPAQSPIGAEGFTRTDAFGHLVWEAGPARPRTGRAPRFCKVETHGRLTVVTINRPEVMNALHPLANEELSEAFDAFEADPDQWVAILTGAGEQAFCTGNDLKFTADAMRNGERPDPPRKGFAGLTARWGMTKPVIAAVNGAAFGGGFEIALACDLIIAADHARFALPEPKVGLAALAGGLQRLPRQIGQKQAMGMIITGRSVSAEEGRAMGFVNDVVPAGDLMPAAHKWAEDILACSPMSVRASKQIVASGQTVRTVREEFEVQDGLEAVKALFRSDDIREGPRAFVEKRAPRWKGS